MSEQPDNLMQQHSVPETTAHTTPAAIQAKLTIGDVADPLEHEADVVADRVVHMADPGFSNSGPSIQRKCSECEEEEETVQRQPLASFIQRKESGQGCTASSDVSTAIADTRGTGSAMQAGTKSFMESRFGADFSDVHIHTGDYAVQLSRQLNAAAFTVGNDVYFNHGKYDPQSSEGKQLLAHELTHTLQQSESIRRRPFGSRPPYASIPIDYEMIQDPVERMEMMRADYEHWRWKNALERLDKGELEDADLQYESLRNRLTGLKTSEVTALITKIKAFQDQRDKDVIDPAVKDPEKKRPVTTAKIVEWLEVRKVISTPMPENATVNYLLPGMIDSYSVSFNDVIITVKPDTHGASGNETGPTANFTGQFSWLTVGGKITELKKDGVDFNPTKLEVTIVTQYKNSPDDTSGYGKGTTESDKYNQTTTLRVHEGQHGTDFITYLSKTPMPVSLAAGINGQLTPAQFAKLLAYIKDITKDTCESTDQIGFSQDEFLNTPGGRTSGITSCRRP
jgi:hypothetical protein